MNIFILDKDALKAAQLQCDKHVVKMIVESAQMLSTSHRVLDGLQTRKLSKSGKRMVKYWIMEDYFKENTLYKAVHMNHPCTVWTMESLENYSWHYDHFLALCAEYTHRYGKTHATQTRLADMLSNSPINIQSVGLTPFRMAMQNEPQCMNKTDIVQSYRNYYKTKKDRFKMVWSRREIPNWFDVATVNGEDSE